MNLSKLRVQKMDVLKKNQPELYIDLKKEFPSYSDTELGKIAGFVIEYVIQSGGHVEIFSSDASIDDIESVDDFDDL